ncbi:pyocin activator PrtN family protein [Paraburkholderia ferrariae]|uniref:pyocin activator PrtN family protein n=1 Tax=Paraburkholderia ferrariae TaxID=386056 RepID=UPI000A001A44|nr:pyocin activator PrtN family protein [Paraburkholderia ferrariae]
MNTVFLLLAQYGATAVIPIDAVCRDYFAPLTLPSLRRKIATGDIDLPLVRMEAGSQKSAQGVHVQDLANYIDARRAAALKECEQLRTAASPDFAPARRRAGARWEG